VETKQVEAHITHEDGYCSLVCQIIWQPTLQEENRQEFLASLERELDRIMQGKK
jgi:hypothetical protein